MEETLETKVAVLVERVNGLMDRLEREDHPGLEKRVADLEKSRAVLVFAGGLGGAVLAWAGNFVAALLTK